MRRRVNEEYGVIEIFDPEEIKKRLRLFIRRDSFPTAP